MGVVGARDLKAFFHWLVTCDSQVLLSHGGGGGRNTTIETSFVHHHLFQASGSVLGFTMSADKGQKPSECHTAVKPTPSLEPFAIGISTKLSNLST